MSEIQKKRKTINHNVLVDEKMNVCDPDPHFFEFSGNGKVPSIKSTSYKTIDSDLDDGSYYFDLGFTVDGVEYMTHGASYVMLTDDESYSYYFINDIKRISDGARMYPIYMSRNFDMSNYSRYTDELGRYRFLMNGLYALLQEREPKI